jgi:hypothetical protein
MLSSGASRLALLTVVGALLAAASTAPAASAATQRYASPNGSDPACSAASPCSIRQAVEDASGNEEVIVAPGDYPLTTTLATPYSMTIHGVAGQPRPRLLFSGGTEAGLRVIGSTLRYVEVDQSGPTRGIWASQSSLDQVIAKGADQSWATVYNSQSNTISNSIFVSSGNSPALETGSSPAPSISTYRNVTAIATGSGGVAIEAAASAPGANATILARNVIARGGPGGAGLRAWTDSSGSTAKITVGHSNWLGGSTSGTNASIADAGGNQTSAPAFVDAAAGDYRQAPGSPTIDAGLNEFLNGLLDVDGDPREIGTTDIGADEFFVAPAATTGPAGALSEQSATLTGSVSANGVPTIYWFEYGPTTAYGSATPATDAGSGGAVAATATLGGLTPATTYHYRLVAANSGVTTNGADRTFTTASPPSPTPSSPPSSPASTTPSSTTQTSTTQAPAATSAFAGVKLVSSRLSFGGRFVTLRLSCPPGTVGRCLGRTKLTAKRRAGSRAARSVTLGRAPFSIAAASQAKVRVRVSRAGRRLLGRARHLRARDTNAARDGAGGSKTTVAAVTIRHRRR